MGDVHGAHGTDVKNGYDFADGIAVFDVCWGGAGRGACGARRDDAPAMRGRRAGGARARPHVSAARYVCLVMRTQPFDQVVAHYGAMVLRVCRSVLGPHTDADDAWQETFLAALRAWPRLPEDADVEAWLVTIARRKAIDVTRARARLPVTGDALPERATPLGNPEEQQLDLWRDIATLPPKQRRAVVYHYIAGLPYADVAELIGGSTDAARRASADGVAALRRRHPDLRSTIGGDDD